MAQLKLYITFNGTPESASASVANLKFNKLFWYATEWDDGVIQGVITARQLWEGNNYKYSDGCGNLFPYRGAIGLTIGSGYNFVDASNPAFLDQLRNLINAGWDVSNHSRNHNPGDQTYQVAGLNSLVRDLVNYEMNAFIIPVNYAGFADASYEQGYLVISSQGDYFDSFNTSRYHKILPVNPALPNPSFFPFIRNFVDEFNDPGNIAFLKDDIDLFTNGQRNFNYLGTHESLTDPARLAGFTEVFDYLKTILADRGIVCSAREAIEYRQMRSMPLNQSLSGNVLTLTWDTATLPLKNSWKDISVNVISDKSISNVAVEGFDSCTFNPTTGLVNGFKRTLTWDNIPVSNILSVPYGVFKIHSPGPDPDPGYDTVLNSSELTATNIYYAGFSEKYGALTTANNGDSVGKLLDRKSVYPLLYIGDATPAFLGRPPFLRTNQLDRPYIRFENTPHTSYESNPFSSGVVGVPHAMGVVMEILPGQSYEAYTPGGGSGNYLGDIGGNLRVGHSNGSKYGVDGTYKPFFQRFFVLVEFKSDTMDVYIDSVFIGSVLQDLGETGVQNKIINALAVETNNAVWNFFAMYIWTGGDYNALVANRVSILNGIGAKWNLGLMNPNPHAYDLDYSFNSVTRNFTPISSFANATPIQIASAEYTWVLRGTTTGGDGGNFNNQRIISTNKILNESEYLMYNDREGLSYYVAIPGFDAIKSPSHSLPPQ